MLSRAATLLFVFACGAPSPPADTPSTPPVAMPSAVPVRPVEVDLAASRRAAAARSIAGKTALVEASKSQEPRVQLDLLRRAHGEYANAATLWAAVAGSGSAEERYEASYWTADARHKMTRLSVLLHRVDPTFPHPTKDEVAAAIAAAEAVRAFPDDARFHDDAVVFIDELKQIADRASAPPEDSRAPSAVERR